MSGCSCKQDHCRSGRFPHDLEVPTALEFDLGIMILLPITDETQLIPNPRLRIALRLLEVDDLVAEAQPEYRIRMQRSIAKRGYQVDLLRMEAQLWTWPRRSIRI